MAINVDDVVTDADVDNFLGGHAFGGPTLAPRAWGGSLLEARAWALDEVLRLFKRAFPALDDSHVSDPSILKRAIILGASSRLYQLAVAQALDPNVFLVRERQYRKELDEEIRHLVDTINTTAGRKDPKGRGRRSVSIVRR